MIHFRLVSRSDTRIDLLAAVVLLLMATVAFVHRIFFDAADDMVFANSDLFRYFNPLAEFFHDSIRRGELPLWNPYQLAGVSLLASHEPALLYPPNLLAWGLSLVGCAVAPEPVTAPPTVESPERLTVDPKVRIGTLKNGMR